MKKITKKSLDELAKIMPPLSEEEQRGCIGGTLYFNESGVFLTQIGAGADARICASSDFSAFMSSISWTGTLDGYFAQLEIFNRLDQSIGSPSFGGSGSYNGSGVEYNSGTQPQPYLDASGNLIYVDKSGNIVPYNPNSGNQGSSSVSGSYNGIDYSTNSCGSFDYGGLMGANAAGIFEAPTFITLSQSASVASNDVKQVIKEHYTHAKF